MTQTTHRRAAGGGHAGGFTWTSLDGQIRLFIPWRDLLEGGRPSDARFGQVVDALYDFDKLVADDERDFTTVAVPTPNATYVEIDDATFEAELAQRLVEHKGRMEDMRRG